MVLVTIASHSPSPSGSLNLVPCATQCSPSNIYLTRLANDGSAETVVRGEYPKVSSRDQRIYTPVEERISDHLLNSTGADWNQILSCLLPSGDWSTPERLWNKFKPTPSTLPTWTTTPTSERRGTMWIYWRVGCQDASAFASGSRPCVAVSTALDVEGWDWSSRGRDDRHHALDMLSHRELEGLIISTRVSWI